MTLYARHRPIESLPAQADAVPQPCVFPARPARRVPTSLLTAGLWLMAAALVLWGLEYRLSLYQPHRGAAGRVSAAKLWVEPRSDRGEFVARLPVDQPNHDRAIYLAGTVQRCQSSETPFRCFVTPTRNVDARIASGSPRSPRLRSIPGSSPPRRAVPCGGYSHRTFTLVERNL